MVGSGTFLTTRPSHLAQEDLGFSLQWVAGISKVEKDDMLSEKNRIAWSKQFKAFMHQKFDHHLIWMHFLKHRG